MYIPYLLRKTGHGPSYMKFVDKEAVSKVNKLDKSLKRDFIQGNNQAIKPFKVGRLAYENSVIRILQDGIWHDSSNVVSVIKQELREEFVVFLKKAFEQIQSEYDIEAKEI